MPLRKKQWGIPSSSLERFAEKHKILPFWKTHGIRRMLELYISEHHATLVGICAALMEIFYPQCLREQSPLRSREGHGTPLCKHRF